MDLCFRILYLYCLPKSWIMPIRVTLIFGWMLDLRMIIETLKQQKHTSAKKPCTTMMPSLNTSQRPANSNPCGPEVMSFTFGTFTTFVCDAVVWRKKRTYQQKRGLLFDSFIFVHEFSKFSFFFRTQLHLVLFQGHLFHYLGRGCDLFGLNYIKN